MDKLPHFLQIDPSGEDVTSETTQLDAGHTLTASVDQANGDIHLNFSSRQALYDFARSLLHEAVFETSGQKEFYPLGFGGKQLVVGGARLTPDSGRIFVFYPSESDPAVISASTPTTPKPAR